MSSFGTEKGLDLSWDWQEIFDAFFDDSFNDYISTGMGAGDKPVLVIEQF